MNMMGNRMGMMPGGNMGPMMAGGQQGGQMMGRGPPPTYGMNNSPHMGAGPVGSPNMTMMGHSPGQYIHSPASQVHF